MNLLSFPIEYVFALSSVLLLAGIFSSKVSSWVNAPALLMFLAVGMLAGSEGIARLPFVNWKGISFDDYGLANFIGSMALCYILFSGGLDTSWRTTKSIAVTGGILASVGVALTALLMGLMTYWCFGMPLEQAILLGAIISSTDAAAVFSILRSKGVGLKGRMQPLLELESGSNDPMAAFLTLFMIGILQDPGQSYWVILPAFLMKMGIGLIFGLAIGKLAVRLFDRIALEYDGLYFVMGMGIVLFAFGVSEILGGNGFMAVYVCGMAMGNSKFLFRNGFKRFHDGIAWLMQVTMFLILGLLVFPTRLPGIALEGVVLAVVLMFVARPVAVFLCMIGSGFKWREKALVSWVGLRGAAPIVLATFPAIHGVSEAEEYFSLVFFIVLMSVLIQGKTLMPAARLLGLDQPLKSRPRSPLEFEETGGRFRSEMHEHELPAGSVAAGVPLSSLDWPGSSRVLLISRQGRFLIPKGASVLEEGDELLLLAEPEEYARIRVLLAPGGGEQAE